MKNNNLATVEQLSSLFSYDADSGLLTRRVAAGRGGREKAGSVVGSLNGVGYLVVTVFGKRPLVHRIAFAMAHGRWPEGQIDHIDGNRTNNRLSNLREASQAENSQNQRRPRGNTASGILGVRPQRKKWCAEIKLNGDRRFIGTFDTAEEARAAYVSEKRKIHPFSTI